MMFHLLVLLLVLLALNDKAQTPTQRERWLHSPSLWLTKRNCNSMFIPKQDRSCCCHQHTMILPLLVLLALRDEAQTPTQRERWLHSPSLCLPKRNCNSIFIPKARLTILPPTARNDPSSPCTSPTKRRSTNSNTEREMATFTIPLLAKTKLQQHIHSEGKIDHSAAHSTQWSFLSLYFSHWTTKHQLQHTRLFTRGPGNFPVKNIPKHLKWLKIIFLN